MNSATDDILNQVLLKVDRAAAVDRADFLDLFEDRMLRRFHEAFGDGGLSVREIFGGSSPRITNSVSVTETCEIGSGPNIQPPNRVR